MRNSGDVDVDHTLHSIQAMCVFAVVSGMKYVYVFMYIYMHVCAHVPAFTCTCRYSSNNGINQQSHSTI